MRFSLAGVLGCIVLVGGCLSPVEQRPSRVPPRVVSRPRPAPVSPPCGVSVEGRRISYQVLGSGTETVLILAGIHGSEPAGGPLVKKLVEYLASHPEILIGRRVVVVPETNPDGLAMRRRTNARGIDLNRDFPARNKRVRYNTKRSSEPETKFIVSLTEFYRPARIVTIHQALRCVDWDGPGRPLAEAVSQACGLPVRKLGARPGSLGSYAGVDRKIPTITLELPKAASRQNADTLWRKYGDALLTAICFDARTPVGK